MRKINRFPPSILHLRLGRREEDDKERRRTFLWV
jgi:hypothetical protein